jgi:excisionase family DNA binding protein
MTQFLSLVEAGDRIGIGHRAIRAAVKRGELPAFRLGAALKVDAADLDRFIEASREPAPAPPASVAAAARRPGTAPPTSDGSAAVPSSGHGAIPVL